MFIICTLEKACYINYHRIGPHGKAFIYLIILKLGTSIMVRRWEKAKR